MAAGYLSQLSGGQIEVRPAGSEPADKINPIAVEAMAEEGIDIAAERPKILTTEAVKASDVVITMGCATPAPTTIPANATRTGSSTTRRPGSQPCQAHPRPDPPSRRIPHRPTPTLISAMITRVLGSAAVDQAPIDLEQPGWRRRSGCHRRS